MNRRYPSQSYSLIDQNGRQPMPNMIPMGMQMQHPSQYPYQSQMVIPMNNVQPTQQMMMPSPYQGQPIYSPMNAPLKNSAISKSRTSIPERQNLPQQQWYPQQAQVNPPFTINQPQMSGYDMRPSRIQLPQMTNYPQQHINGNMAYPPIPVGYNMGSQNFRPQKINNALSTIPNLPMLSYPQMMNHQPLQNHTMINPHQALNNHPTMNNPQMAANSYGKSSTIDRPQSSQIQSRPSSAGSQLSVNQNHRTSFKTGVSNSAQSGRYTPVEKKSSLTTRQRYMKNSKGSLAALDYETYDLEDWKRQKNRDENMKLPSGLGHTDSDEWKTKVFLITLMLSTIK